MLAAYVRVLLAFYRRRAREYGIRDGRTGTLTVIQRCGSGLNLNVHFHALALDRVFSLMRRAFGIDLLRVRGAAVACGSSPRWRTRASWARSSPTWLWPSARARRRRRVTRAHPLTQASQPRPPGA